MIARTIARPALKFLKLLGPWGRRKAWDFEFTSPGAYAGPRSETMMRLVAKYGGGKHVVELGCGDGSLSAEMNRRADASYQRYVGYDVSAVAVGKARERDLPATYEYGIGDMAEWTPTETFDLLIIEEAIYYLTHDQQHELLWKVFRHQPEALVLIAIHDIFKHKMTVATICGSFSMKEFISEGDRGYFVLSRA